MLHHHLLPIPGTGRERSTVMDAGDLLEVLIHAGVHVVLSGHKHVPYVWRLEDMYIANAGTVSSLRVRGYTKPCYNVLEFDGGEVKIHRKFPFGDGQRDGALLAAGRSSTASSSCRSQERTRPRRRVARPGHTNRSREGSSRAMRVIVLVDGEHYPPVTRWGDRDRPRARARGRGRAAGGRDREDRARRAARSRRAAAPVARRRPHGRARRCDRRRSRPRACSTCPTSRCSGYRERMELVAVTLVARASRTWARTSGSTRRWRARRSPRPRSR